MASHNAEMETQTSTESQRVEIQCTEDSVTTRGFVLRRDIPQGERFTRAAKIFGGFFLAATFTIFVPILHFILPPLFLILGAVMATSEYLGKGEILTGQIECPNCKKLIVFLHESEEWPRNHRCPSCSFTLKIEKAGF